MHLTFLGVRGSTPAPGQPFARYGGHTSCIAVRASESAPPTLLLDAGTGLRSLSGLLGGEPFAGTLLLSHLHWDHVQGIPFCVAVDRPDARTDVLLPAQDGRSGRDLLAQQLSPPAFPIAPEGLQGAWSFQAIEPGRHRCEGFDITAAEVAHKGGRTFGYRVERGGHSAAYLPDHAPARGVSDDALAMLRGVDVLLHDAQFVESERRLADGFGHATVLDAVELATRVGAGLLVLVHHSPGRVDDAMDRLLDGLRTDVRVVLAPEGLSLDLAG